MDTLLKLYYNELEKNRKKFYIISIFVVFFLMITIYIFFSKTPFSGSEYTNIRFLNELKNVAPKFFGTNIIDLVNKNSIYLSGYEDFANSMLSIGAAAVVIMSLDIVIRDYKNRNRSICIYATLPVKIWQIKISKILCGISLYWFYVLMILISLFIMNTVFKIFGGEYISGLYPYISKSMIYMPISPLQTLFIMFIYIPTCVIGIQTFSSFLCFNNDIKNRFLVKKILMYTIMTIFGILMILFLGLMQISKDVGFVIGTMDSDQINIKLIRIGIIIFPIISFALLAADCKITKKRLRGGINVKKI